MFVSLPSKQFICSTCSSRLFLDLNVSLRKPRKIPYGKIKVDFKEPSFPFKVNIDKFIINSQPKLSILNHNFYDLFFLLVSQLLFMNYFTHASVKILFSNSRKGGRQSVYWVVTIAPRKKSVTINQSNYIPFFRHSLQTNQVVFAINLILLFLYTNQKNSVQMLYIYLCKINIFVC